MLRLTLIAAMSTWALAACSDTPPSRGGGGSPASAGRCDYAFSGGATGLCDEYAAADVADAAQLCATPGGDGAGKASWVEASCTKVELAGRCVIPSRDEADGRSLGTTRHYYKASYTETDAREDCRLNEGSFSAM